MDENGKGSLGRQGINGLIWGLITLDSMYYEIPEGAYYSRDDIIVQILGLQLADGGWALTGSVSDPDITAMTLQCFAPYYNSEKEYTYLNGNISELPVVMKVRRRATKRLRFCPARRGRTAIISAGGCPIAKAPFRCSSLLLLSE